MEINNLNSLYANTVLKNNSSKDSTKNFGEVLNTKIAETKVEGETKAEEIKKDLIEKNEKLMEACQQLETVFIKELLKSSEVKFNKGGMFEESNEEKTFKDMLNDQYAEKISKGNGMGIADMMYRQLKYNV